MIDLEIRMLFVTYDMHRNVLLKELESATDEKTKAGLNKEIKELKKLQLELIEEFIELFGTDISPEMQSYLMGEKRSFVDNEIIKTQLVLNWLTSYQKSGE